MICIDVRGRAAAQIREVETYWGSTFRREYDAVLCRLQATPRAGWPYVHPRRDDLLHILLRACQHYVYYTYDAKTQRFVIEAVWSNARGSHLGRRRDDRGGIAGRGRRDDRAARWSVLVGL